MALSSAEAEYMAASKSACAAIWMRKILVGLFGFHLDPTVIYCDNHSCIKLSINTVFHDRFKHIYIYSTIISDIVCRGESCCFSKLLRNIKMHIFWQRCSPGENLNTIETWSGWRIVPSLLRGSVEIQQEDPSENYAPTLGWSLSLFLGGCLYICMRKFYL